MRVIGIMGDDFGGRVTPQDFYEDMGSPVWVDECIEYERIGRSAYRVPDLSGPLFLVAFSRGCDVARQLSCTQPPGSIRGAILVEGPCFAPPCGEFPVWLGYNGDSRRTRYRNGRLKPLAKQAIERWSDNNRKVTVFGAFGRHVKRVPDRPRTMNLGHGWDTSLNDFFEGIIQYAKTA